MYQVHEQAAVLQSFSSFGPVILGKVALQDWGELTLSLTHTTHKMKDFIRTRCIQKFP